MNLEKVTNTLGVDNYLIKLIGFFAGILVLSIFCFIDDLKNIRPVIKLIGQILAATIIAFAGIRIDQVNIASLNTILNIETVSILITILWIVGITNAINLLDGLDGLSSGIALISCISLLIIFALNGSPLISIILITALDRRNCRVFTF
jgi:UDP-GlcNAc:undecaprenyl-phosphate GlcNAc-1-phosphate transferase